MKISVKIVRKDPLPVIAPSGRTEKGGYYYEEFYEGEDFTLITKRIKEAVSKFLVDNNMRSKSGARIFARMDLYPSQFIDHDEVIMTNDKSFYVVCRRLN